MIEYDSEQIDEDFDDAEWGEAEGDDEIKWEEQEDETTVSISMQSSLTVNADDDAEDWADEVDSEYNE
jgi:hypothetical protein